MGYKPSGSKIGLVGDGSAATGTNALSRGLMRPANRSGELSGYKPIGSKIGLVGAGVQIRMPLHSMNYFARLLD